jgi:hypothetical protein
MVKVPFGRHEAEGDRHGGLKRHRPGDVAHRQGVLVAAHPEDAVELLREFGRQRREHQREHQGGDAERLGDRHDLLDEELRPADDHHQPDHELGDDRDVARRILLAGVEREWRELVHVLALAAVPDRPPGVGCIGDQQPDRPCNVNGPRLDQPQGEPGGEAGQKEAEVATQRALIGGHLRAAAPRSAERERAGADQQHGDRAQHERGADDGADRDLLGLAAREHRDNGNHRLRQRRTDCGQQASHGSFTEVETLARPLDRVREQDRAADDQRECRREQEPGHAEAPVPALGRRSREARSAARRDGWGCRVSAGHIAAPVIADDSALVAATPPRA